MPENKNTVLEDETLIAAEEDTAKEVENALEEEENTVAETTTDIKLEYDPNGFTRNLDKMGLGMLGIFVVIGIIIIATSLLSKIKSKDAQ